jgi:CTP synthase (UTP-ammonia lyase)
MIHIGLIGEYKQRVKAHVAIPQALELAARDLACAIEFDWLETSLFEQEVEQKLARYQALWFVPNTPYISMEGALQAITFAREHFIPALGTCGGCQHMIIEYARNILGMVDADHAEVHPTASTQLIVPLACSRTEITTSVHLTPDSRAAMIYGMHEITEQYGTCNYGPNAQFWPALEQGGLVVSGADIDGDARIIEISQHPFFIGTLFQPERSAFRHVVHPLIKAFLQAAQNH